MLNFTINPEEAVAKGATILAGKLQDPNSEALKNLTFRDVVPHSYGLRVAGPDVTNVNDYRMHKLIHKNTPYP